MISSCNNQIPNKLLQNHKNSSILHFGVHLMCSSYEMPRFSISILINPIKIAHPMVDSNQMVAHPMVDRDQMVER